MSDHQSIELSLLIDKLVWVGPSGSLEDILLSARRKVVAAYDNTMPPRKHRQVKGSMYWSNQQMAALNHECLAARRKFTRSKGHALVHEAWKREKQL